jgi:hypothetical protein
VVAPYRDELESLRRENERLRAELARRPVSRPRLAALLVALDAVLVVALRPWLNGTSEVHFWTALSSVGLFGLAATAAAVGWRGARR